MTDPRSPVVDRAAFGVLLRFARRRRGWSLDELGWRSAVSATTVARLEDGTWVARLGTIVSLAPPLELTADAFAHAYCGSSAHQLRALRSPEIPSAAQTIAGAGAERLAIAVRAARAAVGISVPSVLHLAPVTVRQLERGETLSPRASTVFAFAASIARPPTLHAPLFRGLIRVYAGEDLALDPALLGRLQLQRLR